METKNQKPKLIIFASGSKSGGGSGFRKLVEATKTGVLDAEIVAVVSNHVHGGVRNIAEELGVHFVHFTKPWDAESYQKIVQDSGAEWVALSGWLKLVKGLNPKKTFNIHPALLSQLDGKFGGPGMYGHYVHEALQESLESNAVTVSGATMHFVTDEYDRGPVFFEKAVALEKGMTADQIGSAVNAIEHEMQAYITNLVIHEKISWDGKDSNTLTYPEGYKYTPGNLKK